MFNPVYTDRLTEDDRITYAACVRDMIDLDAVVVVASGNVGVSPCFLLPAILVI